MSESAVLDVFGKIVAVSRDCGEVYTDTPVSQIELDEIQRLLDGVSFISKDVHA